MIAAAAKAGPDAFKTAFGAAAASLLEAHRGLGDAINEASTEAQIKALKGFIDQVRDVRDAVQAL